MKTAEQILEQVANLREPYYLNDVVTVKTALEAMRLYSDQQNKELREHLLNDKGVNLPWYDLMQAEIQRLTKEVEELKRINHTLRFDEY